MRVDRGRSASPSFPTAQASCLHRHKAKVCICEHPRPRAWCVVRVVHAIVTRRLLDFEVGRNLRVDHLQCTEAEDVNCVGADYGG